MIKYVVPVLLSLISVIDGKAFLGMCSMLRNEERWVRSWIEWHLMVGVDHFFILDDNSDDGTTAILEEYSTMGVLTFLNPKRRGRRRQRTLLEGSTQEDNSNANSSLLEHFLAQNKTAAGAAGEEDVAYYTQLALDLNLDPGDNTSYVTAKNGHVLKNGEVGRLMIKSLFPPSHGLFQFCLFIFKNFSFHVGARWLRSTSSSATTKRARISTG